MARVLHYFHIAHTGPETQGKPSAETEPWILKEWEGIEQIISSLDIPSERTKIYQDSLADRSKDGYQPVDHTYPTETAIRLLELNCLLYNSPNDLILRNLVGNGCRLMVTEDLSLIEAGDYLRRNIGSFIESGQQSFVESELARLRDLRDIFIAQRINSTLDTGEIGILFLGKKHQITDKLDEDIEVYQYLGNERVALEG